MGEEWGDSEDGGGWGGSGVTRRMEGDGVGVGWLGGWRGMGWEWGVTRAGAPTSVRVGGRGGVRGWWGGSGGVTRAGAPTGVRVRGRVAHRPVVADVGAGGQHRRQTRRVARLRVVLARRQPQAQWRHLDAERAAGGGRRARRAERVRRADGDVVGPNCGGATRRVTQHGEEVVQPLSITDGL